MVFDVDLNKIQKLSLDTLKEVQDIFLSLGIQPWIDQGTVLGAIRDGDFIPWDDDIDVSVWKRDSDKHPELWSIFRQAGFHVFFFRTIGSVKLIKKHPTFGWRSVDIHRYAEVGDNAYIHFGTTRIPALVKACFRVVNFIDMILEFKRGPDINYKLVQPHLHKITNRVGQVDIPLRASGNSALLNGVLKLLAVITPQIVLFYIKHFVSQIRIIFGCRPLYVESPKWYFERLADFNFLGLPVKVPSPVEEYLRFKFGPDWRKPRRDWNFSLEDGGVVRGMASPER